MKFSRQSIVFVITVIVIYKIFCWGAILNITPDSASYISTTKHFIESGKFINLTNWPSMTLMPYDEPFTDCAPGLPLALSILMKIIEEPLLSAYILQLLFLVVFFFYLYKLFEILKLKNETLLSGILIIAFFPFTSKVLFSFFAELPLGITIVACLYYSIKISYTMKYKYEIWFIAISIFLGSSFKYIGVFTIIPVLIYLFYNKEIPYQTKIKYGILFIVSGILPVVLWFIRNYSLYGYTTYSHKVGHSIDLSVFDSLTNKLSAINNALPFIVVSTFIFLVVLSFFPLFSTKFKTIKSYYLGLYFAFLVNFLGIVFLSMISDFNELGPRLLFPSVICLIICIVYVFDNIISFNFSQYLLILVLLFSLLASIYQYNDLKSSLINYPLEKLIAKQLLEDNNIKNSTHYYSEFENYLLQVYINKPIRFINDINFKNSDTNSFLKLKQTGNKPFFVFADSSHRNIEINPLVKSGTMEKIHLSDYKTSIYKFRN